MQCKLVEHAEAIEKEIPLVLKKVEIVKNNSSGPNINEMLGKLESEPDNLSLIHI